MANEMMAGSDKAMTAKDMKPQIDELEQVLMMAAGAGPGDAGEVVEEAEVEETEAPADEAPAPAEGAPSEDAEVLATALGIEAAQAQALFDAAQQMDKTRGKSGKELADMLEKDFQLRMELEKLAGGTADQMEMDMAEDMGGAMPPAMPPEMPAP